MVLVHLILHPFFRDMAPPTNSQVGACLIENLFVLIVVLVLIIDVNYFPTNDEVFVYISMW